MPCIQESKRKSIKVNPPNSFPSYTAVCQDRPGDTGCAGLVTLIHHSIPFNNIPSDLLFPSDAITEHLFITDTTKHVPVNINNIYIPPASSCPPDFTLNFHLFNFRDNIIMGD